MSLIKPKIKFSLYKAVVSAAVMLSLIGSTFKPQVVKADTSNWLGRALALAEEMVNIDEAEPLAFPVSGEREPLKERMVVVTFYTSRVKETDSTPCITANGHDLCKQYEEQGFGNTIASNCLKFGALVRLPELFGNKVFIVRDRMNERYGCHRLDVWLPELKLAKEMGVKQVKMEVF